MDTQADEKSLSHTSGDNTGISTGKLLQGGRGEPPRRAGLRLGRRHSRTGKPRPGESGSLPILLDGKTLTGNSGRIPGRAVEPPGSRVTNRGSGEITPHTVGRALKRSGARTHRIPGAAQVVALAVARRGGGCAALGERFQRRRPRSPGPQVTKPRIWRSPWAIGGRDDTGQRGRSCHRAPPSCAELQNLGDNSMSECQYRSTIIRLLMALEKRMKDSRDVMTAEFRSNQAKIKIS
ncbi:uncharacterized protein LOC125753332 [Canis lupus dingo]|uniref:uncharacterized protein LOC125753332 n=1 Tax=Canis lupus dingo TaxID=286419 RepID=UPI0020C25D0D|nr:uncharacterized protein LOC125753332 [Canis lupus dingo]